MLEQATRREIEREAEDYITVGTLLRKERDEPRKRAVEKVMASSLTVAQKIKKIQAIDAEKDEGGVKRVVREAAEQAGRQQVSRILRSIKLPQVRASYLAFLFRERRWIREFGKTTHVLEAGLLPPGVRANPDLQEFFVKYLQAWAALLSQKLTSVIEVGWLYLSQRQYNLVVLLKWLCDRILAFDFVHLNYRERDLIDKMWRLESLFLALHYNGRYIDDLLVAIQTVYRKQAKTDEVDDVSDLINRIMTPELTLPSLYNVLVGLNVVKYRKLLTIEDLMRKGLGEVVSSEEYSCDSHVRKRMEQYIEATVDSVKKLHEQLFEVRRINSYISYDVTGQVDISPLQAMYEYPGPRGTYDFDTDQGNVLLFSIRFLRAFDRTFYPLLNGQVLLADSRKGQVFSRAFFQVEFLKLRNQLERLEKGSFHFSNFPLKRFRQIKEGAIAAVGNEVEVVQIIDDEIATLVDMGKTLSRILNLKGLGAAPEKRPEPLSALALQGKPFTLPYAGMRIQARSILDQRTVEEALADAVSICFAAGLHFHDRIISLFLGRERKSAAEIQAKMKTLENILDAGELEELKTLYS